MFFHHRGLQNDVDILVKACDTRALDIAKPNTTPRFADVLRDDLEAATVGCLA
jgi:hypothetical protein